ncbi:hypothetical protein HID58_039686, partial [Brassica napus]
TQITPLPQMEMSMLQESVPTQENYSQNRAVAPSQCRINNNRAQLNINASSYDGHSTGRTSYQGARSALLQHLTGTSSSKWLMIKIFAVIIHQFLIVFLFFVA